VLKIIIGSNSTLGIQKVRTIFTVLTSSIPAWLGVSFGNITFAEDIDCDVKEVRELLDAGNEEPKS